MKKRKKEENLDVVSVWDNPDLKRSLETSARRCKKRMLIEYHDLTHGSLKGCNSYTYADDTIQEFFIKKLNDLTGNFITKTSSAMQDCRLFVGKRPEMFSGF